jgi:hypothetical protein
MLRKPWHLCAVLVLWAGTVRADLPARARISETYGRLPLTFEANAGQVDPAVRFLTRGQGYALFLTTNEAVLRLGGPQDNAVVRLRMAGGNRAPRLAGLEPQPMQTNYLLGKDPARWHTGVPHYARVRYEEVYPGIDLVYRGNQRQLEYDFVVAPGADPKRIRLAFEGADRLTIGPRGELVLHTPHGDLVQHPPVVYQERGGERQPVAGRYVLLSPRQAGFVLGRYDRSRPLVIDPVLAYSTYLGGSDDDLPRDIAVDSVGNAYVTGMTWSLTFPGVDAGSLQPYNAGFNDAFVTKINPAGTAVVYSTYLGGSDIDWGYSIAIDGAGSAYVSGWTDSPDFPGIKEGSIQPGHPTGRDAFVTKIDPTGAAIVYSTYLGGRGADYSLGIAIDGAGNAYVTGGTNSATFTGVDDGSIQSTNAGGFTDAFVTKINPAGTAVVYSTFLGGSESDQAWNITADSQGNAYVTGETASATFPGVNAGSLQPANGGPLFDGFVTKINPTGTATVYSTFLGGSGDSDAGRAIAVDSAGSAYVAGQTNSSNFPGVNAASIQRTFAGGPFPGDGFVTKVNPAGTAIVYSTYLGGSDFDVCLAIVVDGDGNAYVAGESASPTFPGVNAGSLQPVFGGGVIDAMVTKINPTGTAVLHSTYLGGAGNDEGLSLGIDGAGDIYLTGNTTSDPFPGVNAGSLQPTYAGGFTGDGFVAKIGEERLEFFTLAPCRLIDTRNPAGPLGGPALSPGAARLFVVTGACGVPSSAKALSVNVTVTQPTAAGYLQLLPGNQSFVPAVSTLNVSGGQTRANNAVLPLATDGSGSLQILNGSPGSFHVLLDVNGYFAVP